MGKNKQAVTQELSTEDLINKVCSYFMEKIESSFESKFDKLCDKLNNLQDTLNNINKTVDSHQKIISAVEDRCDEMEQHCKKNALRICGLAEENRNETVLDNVIRFFSTKLNITCKNEDFDSVFRIGKFNNTEKPRTILVNFISNIKRSEVFTAKKLLKNNEVSMFEDLTKKRFELLIAAKKKMGPANAWSSNGRIYVWCEKSRKRCVINKEVDLQVYRCGTNSAS